MPFHNLIYQNIVEKVVPDHFENVFGIRSPGFGECLWSCATKSLNLVFCGRQTSVWWMEIHLDERGFLKSIQRSL